jgi:hypothetical protein
MTTNATRFAALLFAPVVLLGTCAAGPAKVWKMSAEEIQKVSEHDLCDALAIAQRERRDTPIAKAEAKRRKISCAEAIETVVSDCSSLKIKAVRGVPSEGVIFTVANSSKKAKSFRIYYQHIQSSLLAIGPGATEDFGVRAGRAIGTVASAISAGDGDNQAMLTNCVTR